MYQERIHSLITNQPKDQPMFLYAALPHGHFPLQSPVKYLAMYPDLSGERQQFAAMMSNLDDIVRNLTETLVESGLYDNTIIIFQSDNGAMSSNRLDMTGDNVVDVVFPFVGGGSNGPLRGEKGSVYEGGTRTPGFVHSPLLHKKG